METILLSLLLIVVGFVAGVVVGYKFMVADTKKLVKEYQDYVISQERI